MLHYFEPLMEHDFAHFSSTSSFGVQRSLLANLERRQCFARCGVLEDVKRRIADLKTKKGCKLSSV